MSHPREGEWLRRGESSLYASDWVSLRLADVVLPDGTRIDHHVVRMPRPAAGTVIVADAHVLMLYRHRFITETWGWEIPAGGVDPGESPAEAAVREAREESGWEPTTVRHLCTFHPANGLLDQAFHIHLSTDAVHVGEPVDRNEAARVEWVAVADLRTMLRRGRITDGLSFGALAYALAVDGLT
ncbi:NUDIX hydrolase [Ilumatobacter sp.]|uniref:NUDIX hydrolase n=1 Tax=Ilumatobacter sp. TaxID=1967498 RepID=UPI003AF9A089